MPLWTIAREWARIGLIGFGGPPVHIALLRRLCVTDRGWLDADEFGRQTAPVVVRVAGSVAVGGIGALVWVAFKVGALVVELVGP